jgi:hypothetical protein
MKRRLFVSVFLLALSAGLPSQAQARATYRPAFNLHAGGGFPWLELSLDTRLPVHPLVQLLAGHSWFVLSAVPFEVGLFVGPEDHVGVHFSAGMSLSDLHPHDLLKFRATTVLRLGGEYGESFSGPGPMLWVLRLDGRMMLMGTRHTDLRVGETSTTNRFTPWIEGDLAFQLLWGIRELHWLGFEAILGIGRGLRRAIWLDGPPLRGGLRLVYRLRSETSFYRG